MELEKNAKMPNENLTVLFIYIGDAVVSLTVCMLESQVTKV